MSRQLLLAPAAFWDAHAVLQMLCQQSPGPSTTHAPYLRPQHPSASWCFLNLKLCLTCACAPCVLLCCPCRRPMPACASPPGHQAGAAQCAHPGPPAPPAALLQRPGATQRHTLRHLHQPAYAAVRSAGSRQRSRGGRACLAGRGALRCGHHPPARPPCGEQHSHGLLLLQQRSSGGAGGAGRGRGAGADPGLGRAPRQRHAAHL